jgi:YihY family inner membrane protein
MAWQSGGRLRPYRDRSRTVDIALETWEGYSRHRTGRNASLLAYLGILTIFPLLLGATTILGFVLENRPNLQDDIVDSAISKIPVIGDQIKTNSGKISGSWLALIIGLGGALWGSLRAFLALQTALDDIWEVTSGRGNYLTQRVRALIGVGVVGAAQLGSVVLAALVGQAGLPRTGQFLLTFGGLGLNIVVIGMMYRFLTVKEVTWSIVWPGTVFAGVLYTVLQFAGTNIMTNNLKNAEDVYGTFAGILALASWISLHALISLVGAELNAALVRRRERVGPTAAPETEAAIRNYEPD